MGNENGTWVMHGLSYNDPGCLHTVEELADYIEAVGFLPLFENGIPGLSVEEHTESAYWWSGDEARDPWEWRILIARGRRIAYGKFFDHKAGFISQQWLPYFANARRSGYDFDALWDDGLASYRQKLLMDPFDQTPEIFSNELKERAHFGKDGEKNFDGTVTALQMQTYLCVCDFRQRLNKKGEPYGWPIAVYTTPEHLWGYDLVTSAYKETPEESHERIREQIRRYYPGADEKAMRLM